MRFEITVNQFLQVLGDARPGLAFCAHVMIATLVTIHALMRKRDIGATLGWIGLAWLSPFLGGFLYFMLGINRVKRRAQRLNVPRPTRVKLGDLTMFHDKGALAPLERAIGRLSGRAAESGNAFATFQNGDEAYPAMLEALAEAKVSIGLSSYIFRADATGAKFIAALSDAKRRGVAVRVIIDGVGGGWILSRAYRKLRREDVPVGRFLHSPLPWRMPLLNLRSHRKILVIDGHIGFTGGMNIADENVLALKPKEPVQDTHFLVRGPVVAQLTNAFAHDWSFVTDEDLEGEAWFPAIDTVGGAAARVITSGPDRDIEKIELAVLQAIASARASIAIMTPYFLPDEQLITALALAAMRGVAVDVVIPERSNHRLVDWATRATIGPMLREGARVWLGPPPFRHTKIMVIDGEWSLVGSSNWDMRSFRLNFELSMEVYDRPLAEALGRFVMANKGRELRAEELDAIPAPLRLRDAAVRLLLPYL
jgi:cardiolipin synthase